MCKVWSPPTPDTPIGSPVIPLSEGDYKRVELLAAVGITEATIARSVLMSPATFRRRKQDDERLVSALDKGRDAAHEVIARALFVKAAHGDVRAIQWWEMTRMGINPRLVLAGDRDQPIEHRHVDGDLEALTPEQKVERLKGIIAGYIGPGGRKRRAS